MRAINISTVTIAEPHRRSRGQSFHSGTGPFTCFRASLMEELPDRRVLLAIASATFHEAILGSAPTCKFSSRFVGLCKYFHLEIM
jgi:hypothetical protein